MNYLIGCVANPNNTGERMQATNFKTYFDKHFPNGLPQVTERQHYVPVRYLATWGTNKCRIAMRTNHSEPKMVGIRDVAVRSWFYEFADLDFVELKTIIDVINANDPDSYERRAFTLFFSASIVPQIAGRLVASQDDEEAWSMLKLLIVNGFYDENSQRCFTTKFLALKINPDVATKGFEMLRRNGNEMVLSAMETAAWTYLDKLIAGDFSFLTKRSETVHIIEYIFLQMFRTVKLGQSLSLVAKDSDTPADFAKSMIPYLQMVFAVQMSHKVMKQISKYELLVLQNDTGNNFITCDYPFVHLSNQLYCDFLFPISPAKMIYLGVRGHLDEKYSFLHTMDLRTVRMLNEKITANAVEQIFATSTEELKALHLTNQSA